MKTRGEGKGGGAVFEMFDKFGYDNCKPLLIEEHPCENNEQLLRRQGHYTQAMECVNKRVLDPSQQAYRDAKREHIAHPTQAYRQEHREYILERDRLYRQTHKEQLYARGSETSRCPCGGDCSRYYKTKHLHTLVHRVYSKQLEQEPDSEPTIADADGRPQAQV